jgi:hypothetical protein
MSSRSTSLSSRTAEYLCVPAKRIWSGRSAFPENFRREFRVGSISENTENETLSGRQRLEAVDDGNVGKGRIAATLAMRAA